MSIETRSWQPSNVLEMRPEDLIEAMPIGVVIVDLDGKILHVNEAAARLFSLERGEALGRHGINFVAKEDVPRFLEIIQDSLKKGCFRGFECAGVTKDGRKISLLVDGTIMKDPEGNPTSTVLTFKDITELKRLQEKESAADREKAELVDAMPDALNVRDLDGRIVAVNPAYTKMFGWKPEEVIGKRAKDLLEIIVKPKDFEIIVEPMEEVIKRATLAKPMETVVLTKDGRQVPISVTYSLVKDAEGNIKNIVTSIRDVTELRKAEDERAKAMAEAAAERARIEELEGFIAELKKTKPIIKPLTFNEKIVRNYLDRIILTLLLEKPASGFELIRLINEKFGVLFGPSTIYPLLYSLTEQGLLDGAKKGKSVFYKIKDRQKVHELLKEDIELRKSLETLMKKSKY